MCLRRIVTGDADGRTQGRTSGIPGTSDWNSLRGAKRSQPAGKVLLQSEGFEILFRKFELHSAEPVTVHEHVHEPVNEPANDYDNEYATAIIES
jgi:hypothetical protein